MRATCASRLLLRYLFGVQVQAEDVLLSNFGEEELRLVGIEPHPFGATMCLSDFDCVQFPGGLLIDENKDKPVGAGWRRLKLRSQRA